MDKGEVVCLLGPNGAGKTTTFRMIIGLLDKTSGTITLDDKPIDYTQTDKIGFLTEERSLFGLGGLGGVFVGFRSSGGERNGASGRRDNHHQLHRVISFQLSPRVNVNYSHRPTRGKSEKKYIKNGA